jgi:2-hydroxychromene-2-carboxylate isomerase
MLEIKRFVAKHGLARYRMNPHFPVNTLMLMRGLVAARRAGVEAAYVEMGLSGLWEEGLKLDDPEVLAARLKAAGLDAERLFADAQSPEVKRSLIETTEESSHRGAFGIPTFFVGSEMFFGKERLGQVEEELTTGGA